jgi:capsular exopolysaccharide synthesis family protein
MSNERGLADLFLRSTDINDVLRVRDDRKLAVLPAGDTPANPTELLGSERMDQLLSMFKELADYVIIDAPPFIVADTMILASKVDGILMVRPGHTRKPLVRATMEQIKMVGARVIGVVLNRIPLNDSSSYVAYSYQYPSTNGGSNAKTKLLTSETKKPRKTISSYADKVANSFKRLFADVTRPGPK